MKPIQIRFLLLGLGSAGLSPCLCPAAPALPPVYWNRPGSLVPLDERTEPASGGGLGEIPRRLIAIDNQGLWPVITVLSDGTLIASVFNRPNHGLTEGDVDCWASADGGCLWNLRGTATRHDPYTNRMNCSAGLNRDGDLIVICSGWDRIQARRNPASRPLQATISISRDGGKSWEIHRDGMPPPVPGLSAQVPFGKISTAANGDLVTGTYAFDPSPEARARGESVPGNLYAVRSRDGGRTWSEVNPIVKGHHVEAALINLGRNRWLAVGRRFGTLDLEAFASEDDGISWHSIAVLGIPTVSSPDLIQLADGRILLTYGNRSPANCGLDARISRDGGKTWSSPQRLVNVGSPDSGYPSAVQFPDGRILIAYYARWVTQHQRYHMGVVNLRPEELVAN